MNEQIAKSEPRTLSGQLMADFRLPSQTVQEFGAELKQLTEKDRADFRRWYAEIGVALKE